MKILYEDININKKIIEVEIHKQDLLTKKNLISEYTAIYRHMGKGKMTIKLLEDMNEIISNLQSLHDNFDDRLMIFILGVGNVGKSTLLNSLVGYEVAKTGILPVTWKIDVYSPETDLQTATIKYKDGMTRKFHIEEAKKIISEEESKAKTSKKDFNRYFQKEIESVRNPEEIKEIEKYLNEKYIYNSFITEVWWPVRNNWLLEKSMLVDTPGFNQYVNNNYQVGNINDYYHKADGILWLVDGLTISAANPTETLNELNSNLVQVGGLRNNIIGVINGMDKVRRNGGDEAVLKVINNAKTLYSDKFSITLGISAKLAFEGIRDNNPDQIEESGILNLQSAIRDLFIAKSEELKNGAKEQGKKKLISILKNKLMSFISTIDEYDIKYKEAEKKLEKVSKESLIEMKSSLRDFYQNYINEVTREIDKNINALGEGQGSAYILEEIYNIPSFEANEKVFIDELLKQASQRASNWRKFSMISEYKYIQPSANLAIINNRNMNDFSFNYLNSLKGFNPLKFAAQFEEESILKSLGKIFDKAMFFLNKGKIKIQLLETIQLKCNTLQELRIKDLEKIIKNYKSECYTILNQSFTKLILKYEYVDKISDSSLQLVNNIDELIKEFDLYDLLKMK